MWQIPGVIPPVLFLGQAPLLANKIIDTETIVIDSKSGVSGAGKTLTEITHYTHINENLLAYKVGNHRHIPEIEQELSLLVQSRVCVNFTPHLVPMNRGILSSIYVTPKVSITEKSWLIFTENFIRDVLLSG